MKKIIILFILFVATQTFAQNNGISYQAIILNPKGEQLPGVNNLNSPLVNKDICMVFKFVDEFSNVEYQETVQTKTDGFGMVNLVIGSGNKTAGYAASFKDIVWNISKKSLIVGINTDGSCTTYIEISNQDFSYVPLALSAISAENVTGVVAIENGGTNAITLAGARTNLQINNVDNTSDANKPISISTQSSLNLKENVINKSTDVVADQNSDLKYPSVKAVKIYIDASTSNNVTALANEITRATNAETTITTSLTNETTARSLADGILTTNLSNETSNRTAVNLLKEDLANKSTSVTTDGASDSKYPSVKSVKTYVDSSAITSLTALANEVSRAKTAENTLTANLTTEATTARAAELVNAAAIATETTNRTAADLLKEDLANKSTNLTTDAASDTKYPSVKSVKTYVDASSSTNATTLANEVTRATTAENTLTTNLATEATIARAAELVLTNDLATEVTNRIAASLLKEDLANKSTNVTTDGASDTKYSSVKSVKTYVDASSSTNATALANEVTRATTAENTLTTNLAAETFTRTSDVTTLQTNINTVQANVDTNETNRIDADDNLQNNIDSLQDNLDASVTVVTTVLALKANLDSPTFTGTVSGITKTMVGLTDVDNTSDLSKPVSTLTQAALDLKVDNVTGKGLSTEDYTTVEKTKLAAITGTNTGDQDISGIANNTTKIGNLSSLTTTVKSNLVAALNEVGSGIATNSTKIGDLSNLTTTVKSNLVAVVNEVQAGTTTNATDIGSLSNLTTTAKSSLVAAVNEIGAGITTKIGDLSSLTTTVKSNLVAAVNEIQAEKANLASPIFTGTPEVPTAVAGTNSNQIATTQFVTTAVAAASENVVDLTTAQTINGVKTFSSDIVVNGINIGNGIGFDNTIIGNEGLFSNTTGDSNTAIGKSALHFNTAGRQNTANGLEALYNNTTGTNNTALGQGVLYSNTTGSQNTSNGGVSLYSNTTGSKNTSNGYLGLYLNTTGDSNTAHGYRALFNNTTGSNNTAIGAEANVSSGELNNATAIGYAAVVSTSNTIQLGNTAVTDVKTSGSITTGAITIPNTDGTQGQVLSTNGEGILSWTTLKSASSDDFVDLTTDQTIAGNKTFNSNLTVNGITVGLGNGNIVTNTATGVSALNTNTNGAYNTAFGYSTLSNNEAGYANTAIGAGAIDKIIEGNNNTAVGMNAGQKDRRSFYNTAVSNSVFIGAETKTYDHENRNNNMTNISNEIVIGYQAIGNGSNTIQLGNNQITSVYTSGNIFANSFVRRDGLNGFLMSDGTVSIEVADEFSAEASQTSFTLTQTPTAYSKVKMYINGIRISNTAYTINETSLTYYPENNGDNTLTDGDRIQFDYSANNNYN